MILFIYNKAVAVSTSDGVKHHFRFLWQRMYNSGKNGASAFPLYFIYVYGKLMLRYELI